MIKVAMFHSTLPEVGRKVGGVEVVVHRLANSLSKLDGVEVTVYSLSECPEGAEYQHKKVFGSLAKVMKRKLPRLFVLPALLNFVDFDGCDILHLHGDDWFFLSGNKKVVRTFYGSAYWESKFATSAKRKFLLGLVYWCEKLSAFLRAHKAEIGLEEDFKYGSQKRLDCGVELDGFIESPQGKTDRVLFIGTWHGRKRGALAYKIFCDKILPKFPNCRLSFIADKLPLEHPNVDFYKNPSDAVVKELFSQAKVFLYPSAYEGFGVPYIEAMASRVAIVTSNNPGSRYVLQKGKYGVICGDEQLGPNVCRLLENETERLALVEVAAQRSQNFDWTSVAGQHLEFYSSILNSVKTKKNH